MVGDSYTDIAAGKAAGLKTVFLGDFKCDVCQKLKQNRPDGIISNMNELINMIENIERMRIDG